MAIAVKRLGRRGLAVFIFAVLVAASLVLLRPWSGRPVALKSHGASSGNATLGEGPTYDWSFAFGHKGQSFTSAASAQQQVTFPIRSPQGYSASDIEVAPTGFGIGWAFNLSAYGGWVHLVESKATMSAQAYADGFKGANVASPTFTQTVVDHGTLPAVMLSANNIGRLVWSDGTVNFDITGQGITPVQVAALVEQMLYGGR